MKKETPLTDQNNFQVGQIAMSFRVKTLRESNKALSLGTFREKRPKQIGLGERIFIPTTGATKRCFVVGKAKKKDGCDYSKVQWKSYTGHYMVP